MISLPLALMLLGPWIGTAAAFLTPTEGSGIVFAFSAFLTALVVVIEELRLEREEKRRKE